MSQVQYIALIDGVDRVFATSEEFTTSMAVDLGFSTVHYGLQLPSGLEARINLRTGMLDDTTAQLRIIDNDGTLAALFGVSFDASSPLITTLPASGLAPASLFSKHVGTEAIGPAGERRRYSCVPGWNVGKKHLGEGHAYGLGLPAAPVSDVPVLWPGRRVCIYRLKRTGDPLVPWTLLTASSEVRNQARVWWGTMLGQGTYEKGVWSFKCAGPESWISGNLGIEFPDRKIQARGEFSIIDEDEKVMRASLVVFDLLTNEIDYQYIDITSNLYLENDTYLAAANDYADVVDAINLFLTDVEDSVINGPALSAQGLSTVFFSSEPLNEGINVRWDYQSDTNYSGVIARPFASLRLTLTLHEKVWRTLGYDPLQQNDERHPVENSDQFGNFFRPNIPALPNHWRGHFWSANGTAMAAFLLFEGYEIGNGGATTQDCVSNSMERQWPVLHKGGGSVFWMDGGGQEITLNTLEPLYLTGSQSHWLLADPNDDSTPYTISDGVGEVNRQGLFVFEGPYRRRGDDDGGVEDPLVSKERQEGRTKQVARVNWREGSDGSVVTDSSGYPRLVIAEWLEPRLYGVEWPKLTGFWGSWRVPPSEDEMMFIKPLAALEASSLAGPVDSVPHVIHATWAATGSGAGVRGTQQDPNIDVGDNASAAEAAAAFVNSFAYAYLDIETADFGLGVPAEMIGPWDTLNTALGSSALLKCKAAFVNQLSARKLFQNLLAPIGAGVSLAGGKYQLFDPWTFQEYEQASIEGLVLSVEDVAGEPGDPQSTVPLQQLRVFSPIDRLELKARVDPTDGKYFRTRTDPTADLGSRYRAQSISQVIDAPHLIHPMTGFSGANWIVDYQNRWRVGTKFWSQQHFTLTLPYAAEDSASLWPGQPVVVSDPWALDPIRAQYGLSLGFGFVTRRTFDARTETIEVELLVSSAPVRLYAPAVSAIRYDEDEEGEGYRLQVESLGYRINREQSDHAVIQDPGIFGFQPPSWYGITQEDTDIEIFQFDGVAWSRGIYGVVSSITPGTFGTAVQDSHNPSGWLNLTGALSGAPYYRDMQHIVVLREASNQSADWVFDLFAPVCGKDGTYDSGTPGKKFV